MNSTNKADGRPSGRLSKENRRLQLIDTARAIIRYEGTDRLTLAYLAEKAGVSKPITYDHFGTRTGLLVDLYKIIDAELTGAMQEALSDGERTLEETAIDLAAAYMRCVADTSGEWHQVGAALSGAEDRITVHQELLDSYVEMFLAVLTAYSQFAQADLRKCCIGLVGAGDALSASMLRGSISEGEASQTFAQLIMASLRFQ